MIDKINDVLLKAVDTPPGTQGLGEKLDQLMPSIYIMVATLGSLIVVMLILTFFFYKPVKKMIKNRQQLIQKNIDDAILSKQNSLDLEESTKQKYTEAKEIALEIINKSKIEADIIKNKYIEDGKNEVDKMLKDAKEQISRQKKALEIDAKEEIINISIQIAKKIIQKEVKKEDASKYLDLYLQEQQKNSI